MQALCCAPWWLENTDPSLYSISWGSSCCCCVVEWFKLCSYVDSCSLLEAIFSTKVDCYGKHHSCCCESTTLTVMNFEPSLQHHVIHCGLQVMSTCLKLKRESIAWGIYGVCSVRGCDDPLPSSNAHTICPQFGQMTLPCHQTYPYSLAHTPHVENMPYSLHGAGTRD